MSGSNNNKREVEVVVFQDPRKRKKTVNTDVASDPQDESDKKKNVFDMKRARYEVFKFALRGFDKTDQKKAKESNLIRLGAKPRKGQYVNYKELMEEKKKEKQKAIEERERNAKGNAKIVKPKKNAQKKRKPNAVRGLDYQVGKYKDGIQFVNKKEFKK